MKKVNNWIIVLILLITVSSCQKPDKDDGTGLDLPNSKFTNTTLVNASISGRVLHENGRPLNGAEVHIGTHTFITDNDGFFYFQNISTKKTATCVKVIKNGFFDGIKNIMVRDGQQQTLEIYLTEMPKAVLIDGADGGVVEVEGGGLIKFPDRAFVNEAAQTSYLGDVQVHAKFIDPSSEDFAKELPGGLRGVNQQGAERFMESKGMLAVELRDMNGNELQLAPGTMARVAIPAPSGSNNPATIATWSLDEENAMWKEEGTASFDGQYYNADVSHFSFWGNNNSLPSVHCEMTFVDQNWQPIENVATAILASTLGYLAFYGNSDATGMVEGMLPENTSFDQSYYIHSCSTNGPIALSSFNTAISDIVLGPFTVDATNSTFIEGTLVDCNGALLANCPVHIYNAGNFVTTWSDATGFFSTNIGCITGTQTVQVTGVDATNNITSLQSINVSANAPNNIGNFTVCGNILSFVNWTVAGASHSITDATGSLLCKFNGSGNTRVSGYGPPKYIGFGISGPASVNGNHSIYLAGDHIDTMVNQTGMPVNIMEYGPVGGRVIGNFTLTDDHSFHMGTYFGQTMNCSFNLTRTQ